MDFKAYLFLDVDGPLNPYAAKSNQRPDGCQTFYLSWDNKVSPKKHRRGDMRVWYNPSHGNKLLELEDLGYKVTWATKWNHLANDVLSPLLGLPTLPVAQVSREPEMTCLALSHVKGCDCLHSKTKTLLEYADGVPFLWVDDETTIRDVRYLKQHATQDHKLWIINPRLGLLDEDFESIATWISQLAD